MSALSAGRVTKEWAPNSVIRSYKQEVSKQIWEGGIVVANASGYAQAATSGVVSTGVYYIPLGVAQRSQLTVSGDHSQIDLHAGYFNLNADTAFSETAIGYTCYIVDDQTVSITGTGRSPAGIVAAIDGSGNPWVKIGL